MYGGIVIGAVDVLDEGRVFHQVVVNGISYCLPVIQLFAELVGVGLGDNLNGVKIFLIGHKGIFRRLEVEFVIIGA